MARSNLYCPICKLMLRHGNIKDNQYCKGGHTWIVLARVIDGKRFLTLVQG